MLLIPLGSMFVIYTIFKVGVSTQIRTKILFSVLAVLLIFLLNGITCYIFKKLAEEKESQKENVVYQKQTGLYTQHMKEMEEFIMDFRKEKHDMKQHIYVLTEMLNHGKNEKAMEYLDKLINRDFLKNERVSKTGNLIIDSLINVKQSVMIQNKIDFKLDIHIPVILPFEEADLSILVGNILDNAIEAVKILPEEERLIKLYVKYDKNILIITAINPFDHELLKDKKGQIVTSKGDRENHGIGLKSMKKIAQKYYGSVVTEVEDGRFIFKVILLDREKDYAKARKSYM